MYEFFLPTSAMRSSMGVEHEARVETLGTLGIHKKKRIQSGYVIHMRTIMNQNAFSVGARLKS